MLEIDPATTRALARFGFDAELLAAFAARAAKRESTTITGTIAPLEPGDASPLPPPGTPEHDRLSTLGRQAIARREVGVVILAGGMATRFGGVVKAAVPVTQNRSFLSIKIGDARLAGPVPIFVMTSAATHDRIVEQIRDEQLGSIECFPQFASLRLTPAGELFMHAGKPELYATGHGDLTFALRASGVLARFRAAGGKMLYMSNVDNLAATLDPVVIGAHLASGAAVTAEVVRKDPGDQGGAPARVIDTAPPYGGAAGVHRAQIVEAFRFPKDFDQDRLALFNTNTFAFDAAAIDRDFDLTYFRVEKLVDGAKVVQFERLVGQLTAFLPSHFLEVPRARFLPVKDPDELEARRADIEALLRARGLL